MTFLKSKGVIALLLILASLGLYCFHYLLFHDEHHILIYLVGDIAFLPLEVLLVSLVIENLLTRKEKKEKLEKLNMVIETFFSEFGKTFLARISMYDKNLEQVKKHLVIEDCDKKIDFKGILNGLKSYRADIDIGAINLPALSSFLREKRHVLLDLLQNPNLLEHQAFTETIMAIFHITEELAARNLSELSPDDVSHTKQDIERAYTHLIDQWLSYLGYIQKYYPYFFLFATRTNPFDKNALWYNQCMKK
jgi:hypothetical protein